MTAEQDLSGIGLLNFYFFISVSALFLLFNKFIPLPNMTIVLMFCIITFVIQFGLNASVTQNPLVCGKLNIGVAFWFTVMPWLLIVLLGNVFLFSFPGWLRVFSNTFGMWISYKVFSTEALRKGPDNEPLEGKDVQFVKIYNEIKQTPQTIINEIDIIGIEKDEAKLKELFDPYAKIYPFIFGEANKADIIKIIDFKNKIGYITWNILFGLIAVMVSTNSLLNSGCSANII
jgi:hypothetical protein